MIQDYKYLDEFLKKRKSTIYYTGCSGRLW